MFNFKKTQPVSLEDKINNVISDFQSELSTLQGESENVLDMFKSTVKRLENINAKIDNKVFSINSQIESLNNIKSELVTSQKSNEVVRGKFKDFLGL